MASFYANSKMLFNFVLQRQPLQKRRAYKQNKISKKKLEEDFYSSVFTSCCVDIFHAYPI